MAELFARRCSGFPFMIGCSRCYIYIYVYRHMGDERGGKGVAASVNVGLSCPACRMRMMMILSAVCSCQSGGCPRSPHVWALDIIFL